MTCSNIQYIHSSQANDSYQHNFSMCIIFWWKSPVDIFFCIIKRSGSKEALITERLFKIVLLDDAGSLWTETNRKFGTIVWRRHVLHLSEVSERNPLRTIITLSLCHALFYAYRYVEMDIWTYMDTLPWCRMWLNCFKNSDRDCSNKKHGEFGGLFYIFFYLRRFVTLDVLSVFVLSHQMFCPYTFCLIIPASF
jgi:hypothetical protein